MSSNYHTIPKPAASSRGNRFSNSINLASLLPLWRPSNPIANEQGLSTLARVAMRLCSRAGEAYTAEETRPAPGTPVNGVKATGTLTGTTIAAEDTVTIEGVTYTFVTALSTEPAVPYEVLVGVSDSASLDNLIAAINGAAGAGSTYGTGTVKHTLAVASAGDGDTLVLTANDAGDAGNDISTTAELTSGDWGATTLENGVDATPSRAGQLLYDSTNLYIALADVVITSTTGWKKIAHASL